MQGEMWRRRREFVRDLREISTKTEEEEDYLELEGLAEIRDLAKA